MFSKIFHIFSVLSEKLWMALMSGSLQYSPWLGIALFLLIPSGFAQTHRNCLVQQMASAWRATPRNPGQVLQNNGFNVSRKIAKFQNSPGYLDEIGPELLTFARNLPREAKILDGGAGRALALEDLALNYGIKADEFVAIGIVRPPDAVTSIPGKNYRYIEGYLDRSEVLKDELGTFAYYMDVQGAFSYVRRPDQLIEKVLKLLKPGGRAHIAFMPHGLSIEAADYRGVGQWLSDIQGAEVRWLEGGDALHPSSIELIRIAPDARDIHVPSLLEVEFREGIFGQPLPNRRYKRQ